MRPKDHTLLLAILNLCWTQKYLLLLAEFDDDQLKIAYDHIEAVEAAIMAAITETTT